MKLSKPCPGCDITLTMWDFFFVNGTPFSFICPHCREKIRVHCFWTWPLIFMVGGTIVGGLVLMSLWGLFQLLEAELNGWFGIAALACFIAYVLLDFGTTTVLCSCATFKPTGIIKPRVQCSLLKLIVMSWAIGIVMYLFFHKGEVIIQVIGSAINNSESVLEIVFYLLFSIAAPICFVAGVGVLCEKFQRRIEKKNLRDDV